MKVIKRNELIPSIKREINTQEKLLTNFQIENFYAKLIQYSHADEEMKKEHIQQIQMKR